MSTEYDSDEGAKEMPWSEVCMHLKVAGKTMRYRVTRDRTAVQLLNEDGSTFSFPILPNEAGVKIAPRPPFNLHRSRTADGVVIEPGLHVFTNEMRVGLVTGDDERSCCQTPGHEAAQMVSEGAWYTDHDAVRASQCTGGCKHDHWFTVTHLDGTKSRMNGERLSTTFHPYSGPMEKAIDKYEAEQHERHVEAMNDTEEES